MGKKTGSAKRRKRPRRRAILLANEEGKINYADLPARRWLRQFFGRPSKGGMLPSKVGRWLSQQGRRPRSLIAKRGKAQLHLRTQDSLSEHSRVLLLELIKSKSEERQRRHLQLTQREREVHFWIMRSKSNSEIATILGIATATVGKHLERVYAKLGVENRTAAATYGLENSNATLHA